MNDPYSIINKGNFHKIKEVLEWGIENQKNPKEIAQAISEYTGMNIAFARALVQEELIGAMEYMKDGNKTSD